MNLHKTNVKFFELNLKLNFIGNFKQDCIQSPFLNFSKTPLQD